MNNYSDGLTRRGVIGAAAGVMGGLAAPAIVRAQGSRKPLKISVGRQPWAAGNSPITQYMMQNKLFEKHAADAGYDLTATYQDYPSALPMVEAIIGGNLDLGMWGNTPIIRVIAAQQPLSMLQVGEGHMRFLICMKDGSPIRNVHDLKGKVVGALLGGDPYNALTQFLRFELGNGDPRASGIRVVNTSTGAQAAMVPTGMDASIVSYPSFLPAQATGTTAIVNSYGYTEAYYKGSLGTGAGILIPSVKQSPFYPDGFYLHRSFWVARNAVIDKDPQVVTAFIIAHQEAVAALTKMDPGAVSQLVKAYWKLPPDLGAKVVRDELLFKRGWAWPTEGDVRAVVQTSKFMADSKQIDTPLTWTQVKGAYAKTAPLMKDAYQRMSAQPADSVFMESGASDLRGAPVWEMDKWSERS